MQYESEPGRHGSQDTLYSVGYPERIVPAETPAGIVALHLKRYEFALPLCAGASVLDLACGVGYGSARIAEVAAHVLGVDRDAGAIAYARAHYAGPNVEFASMDAQALDLADGSFDVVCSFETIEHLADPLAYLAEVARVLRPGGVYVVSTPKAHLTTSSPANLFHTIEWSREDFEALLRRHFTSVELYGQARILSRRHRLLVRLDVLGLRRRIPAPRATRAVVGSAPSAAVTAADVVISADAVPRATELVAVCRGPRP